MDKKKEGISLENKLSKLLQLSKGENSTPHKVKETQRSYSPTSLMTQQMNNEIKKNKINISDSYNEKKTLKNISHNEKKPIKKIYKPIKQYRPVINKNTHEAKILDKLKNFDSIDDLEKEIKRNKEKYEKLFPKDKKKEQIKEKPKYKPGTLEEQKKLKKIEEINDMITIQNTLLGKKRYINKSSSNKQPEMYYNPKEKFCPTCLCMHLPGIHKRDNKYSSPSFN